ncbi:MAG: tetratricopeptide repeat protein [Candidatus Binatia bacterium]
MRIFTQTKATQLSPPLRRPFFFLFAVLFPILSVQVANLRIRLADASSDNHQLQKGRVGCPHCKNDGSEVSRLLQEADGLYANLKSKEALKKFLKVLELEPQNHEALAKLSRVYIDFGDMVLESGPDWQEKKLEQYLIAEKYARKAVKADPEGTWGHFYVAASLGKIALQSSIPKQIDLSREIRREVEMAIALDPQNGFAYHVNGVWHRKMAGIGQMKRIVASVVLWRSVPMGSMKKSVEYLKKAISLNPTVISHHLELAKTYVAMGRWEFARSSLRSVQELPIQFSDDPLNKREAQQLLQEIKDR